MKIKVGDTVVVIAGSNRFAKKTDDAKSSNIGKVLSVNEKTGRLVIEGINFVKRHVKKRGDTPGQVVSFEAPIHASNVMLIDPKTKKRSRVGYKKTDEGKKVRFAKKSNTNI